LVDLDVEIEKCDKKLSLAKMSLDKVRKVTSQLDYEETVPANVRLANEEKVCLEILYVLPRLIVFFARRGKLLKRKLLF
jgi:hypothetical protein